MNGDKIIEAIGLIDEELIAEVKESMKRRFGTKKVIALVAAILILTAISVTSAALGWFEDKIIDIQVINKFFDKDEGIDSYILDFDVEIKEDAKEIIENYYFPMLFINEEYNASANSYSCHFYWEDTEKKQILAFSQHSALTFDEYELSFGEKMKVSKEKFVFCGEEIKCIVFSPEGKVNRTIKQIYWSDGYSIFNITAFNCNDEFIKKVMESFEIVEVFSDYGKFRENRYH